MEDADILSQKIQSLDNRIDVAKIHNDLSISEMNLKFEQRIGKLESQSNLLKWMVGYLVILTTGIGWKLLDISIQIASILEKIK